MFTCKTCSKSFAIVTAYPYILKAVKKEWKEKHNHRKVVTKHV